MKVGKDVLGRHRQNCVGGIPLINLNVDVCPLTLLGIVIRKANKARLCPFTVRDRVPFRDLLVGVIGVNLLAPKVSYL